MSMPSLDLVLATTFMTLPQAERSDYEMVKRAFSAAVKAGISQGVSTGVTALTHVNFLTMALTPWLTAYNVAAGAQTTMDLYDLLPANEGGKDAYACSCGKCVAAVRFSIANREARVAKQAISATIVGMPFVMAYSAGRNAYKWKQGTKGGDRMAHSKQLQSSAMPTPRKRKRMVDGKIVEVMEILTKGCLKAQAAIAILMGELAVGAANQNPVAYEKTIAAVTAVSGWQEIKKMMYGGPF